MSGPQVHHVIQQVSYIREHPIIKLVGGERFMQSSLNLLALPNDPNVSLMADVQRHASNHSWIAQAQRQVLDGFLDSRYQGIAVRDILANPAGYAQEYAAVQQRATVLVNDLRDVTAHSIINKQLPLTFGDGLFPNMTEADIRARAAEILSPDRFSFTPDGTATAVSSDLTNFRTTRADIVAAGGDVRWMAFDTPEKITAYINASEQHRVPALSNRATIEGFERYLRAVDPTGSSLDNTVFARRIPARTWGALPLIAKLGVIGLGLSMISTGAQAATADTPEERYRILQDAGVALGIDAVLMTTGLAFLPATLISIAAYAVYSYSTDAEFREAVNDHVEFAGAIIPQIAQRIINGEPLPSGGGTDYAADPNAPAVPIFSGVVTAPPSGSNPGGQTVAQYFAGLEAELNTPTMSRGKVRSPLPNGEDSPWIAADLISIGGVYIGFVVREQGAPQVAMSNGAGDPTYYDAPYGRLFMTGPNSGPDADGLSQFSTFGFVQGIVPESMTAEQVSQTIMNTALQDGAPQRYGSSVEQLSSTPNTSIVRIVNRVTQQVEIRVAQSGGFSLPVNSTTILREVTAEWSFSRTSNGEYSLTRKLYNDEHQEVQSNSALVIRQANGSFQMNFSMGEGMDAALDQEFERMAQSLAPALGDGAETVVTGAPARDLASAIERGTGPVRVPIAIFRSKGNRIADVATRIVADRLGRDGSETADPDQFQAEYESQVRTIELAGNIGQVFGSTLGRAIAGEDRIAQLALSGVLGSLTESAGQAIATGLAADSLSQGVDTGFAELPANLKSAALGAISSVLTAELIDVLGFAGIGGELTSALAGSVIGEIANNIAAGRDALLGVGSAISLGAAVGSLLGNKLANAVISFDTVGGQLGAAIGSSLGVIGGTAYLYSIGFIPGLLPVAALAFVGTLIGGFIGSLFGGTPRSGADVVWDAKTNEFVVSNAYSRKGGSREAASNLAAGVSANLNGFIVASGGTLLDPASIQAGNYGMHKKDYVYRSYSTRSEEAIAQRFSGKTGAESLVNYGLLQALSDPDFQLAGGNAYVKRAIYARIAADGATGSLNTAALLGDISVAQDWAFYRGNAGIVEAIAGTMPEGAERNTYLAGWTITAVRARELGLDSRAVSDWFGGFGFALDQAGILATSVGFSFDYDLLSDRFGRQIQFGSYVVGDAIDVAGQDLVEGTTGNDVIALSGTNFVTGSAGVRLNRDVFDGQARAIEIAAQIEAGAGNDIVHASDRGDNIFGDEGDDTLHGGLLDDWLLGGAGNDTIDAGAADVGALGGNGNFLDGGTGDDLLIGREGSDWLEGSDGSDTLMGGAGDDILAGGSGEGDNIKGGTGSDQYLVRQGDGADFIDEETEGAPAAQSGGGDYVSQRMAGLLAGTIKKNWVGTAAGVTGNAIAGGDDSIIFGVGIEMGDIQLVRSSTDADHLIVRVMKIENGVQIFSGTQITVKDWFADSFKRVEWLKFTDGTEIRIGDITSFIVGGDSDDVLIGTEGNDFVYGGGGDDQILLFGGDDIGNGGTGNDMVAGHEGKDLLIGGLGVDQLIGGNDKDVLSGDGGGDDLYGGDADDILSGGRGDGDVVVGGAGNDTFKYSRGDGRDVMFDEFGDHWQTVWQNGQWNEGAGYHYNAATGELTGPGGVYLRKNVGTSDKPDLQWLGRFDYDRATNILRFFNPPAGAALSINSGVDTIELAPGINIQDVVMTKSADGHDLVLGFSQENAEFSSASSLADSITLKDWDTSPGQIEKLAFYQTGILDISTTNLVAGTDFADGTADAPLAGSSGSDWITGGAGDDLIAAGGGNDILAGHSGSDLLRGEGGDDVLYGGAGNDVLDGGAGNDVLIGGSGIDTASYASSASALRVHLSAAFANTGKAEGDEYSSIENLLGGGGSDLLGGDDSDNEITGGLGNDTLLGGEGDDTYVWNTTDGADVINDSSFVVEEAVTLAGALAEGFTVTWESTGQLQPGYSNRYYWRLRITDTSGNLIYDCALYAPTAAVPSQPAPAAYIQAGWLGGFARTNGQQVTREKFDTTVNAGDDVLEMGPGVSLSDLSFIVSGNDLIVRYGGSATSQITIRNHFSANSRIETLQFQDGLAVSLDSILTASGAPLTGTSGDDLLNGQVGAFADQLDGGAGHDVLSGGAGNDTLSGGTGDDIVEGGAGADRIDGGAHSAATEVGWGDTARYVRSSAAVQIDLRNTTTGQAGGDAAGDILTGIENLTGSAFGDTLTGDDGGNRIDGLDGNNVIRGNGGDDVLIGGSGTDTLYGDDGDDAISGGAGGDTLEGGAGNDRIDGGDGYDYLYGGGGNDTLTGGSGGGSLYGDDGDDTIVGGGGTDWIDGGLGNDTLTGDAGSDTLAGGDGDDVYIFEPEFGSDTIIDFTGQNKIVIGGAVNFDQVWFSRSGSNLQIGITGTSDRLTLQGYFASSWPTLMYSVSTATHTIFLKHAAPLISAMTAIQAVAPEAMPDQIKEQATGFWHVGDKAKPTASAITLSIVEDNPTALTGAGVVDHDDNIVGYSLQAQAEHGAVSLNAATGQFVYTPVSDFNGEDAFTILATDADGQAVSVEVKVTVSAVNDAPRDLAIEGGQVLAIDEAASGSSTLPGSVVGRFVATDIEGSALTYTLANDAGGAFAITFDGRLMVNDASLLNYEIAASHTIRVQVRDAYGAAIEQDFTVAVRNVNEAPGTPLLSESRGLVSEGSGLANGWIARFSVADPDGTTPVIVVADTQVRFKAVGNELRFADGYEPNFEALYNEGLIASDSDGDGLLEIELTARVRASDGSLLSLGDASASIRIEDVNEAPSAIEWAPSVASVAERDRVAAGTGLPAITIGSLNVVDPDIRGLANGSYVYSVSDSRFEIIGDVLRLKQGAVLDYEAGSAVSVIVTATDRSANPFSIQKGITIAVADADDVVEGDSNANAISGQQGRDLIYAHGGNDIVDGGAGHDLLDGGAGDDVLLGGAGIDRLLGGAGNDRLEGGDGDDYGISGTGIADGGMWGGDGDDRIIGGSGMDLAFGEGGNDTFVIDQDGGNVLDRFDGGDGIDTITYEQFTQGIAVDLTVRPFPEEPAAVRQWGDVFTNIENVTGSDLADTIVGNEGANVLDGRSGDDALSGLAGDDQLRGEAGNDVLVGGDGNDLLEGGLGNDIIYGGNGNDVLRGGAGSDQLFAENGDDILDGGADDDLMVGGEGNDTYILSRSTGADTINNFDLSGTDILGFQDAIQAINAEDLWFEQIGDDMLVSVIGAAASARIVNWYQLSAPQRGSFKIDFVGAGALTAKDIDVEALATLMQGRPKPASIGAHNAMLANDSAYRIEWEIHWARNERPALVQILDQVVNEDGSIVLTVRATDDTTPNAGIQISSQLIEGASLIASMNWGAPNGAGERTLTLVPVANRSGYARISLAASDANGAVSQIDFRIDVLPVADTPSITQFAGGMGNVGQVGGIPLALNVAFPDGDGSELQEIWIAGVPAGVTLSAGTYDSGTGIWKLSPAQTQGLRVNAPAGWSRDLNLSVTARASEGGQTAVSSTASTTVVINAPPSGMTLRGLDTSPVPRVNEYTPTSNPNGARIGVVVPIDPDSADNNLIRKLYPSFASMPPLSPAEARIVTATGPTGTPVEVLETGNAMAAGEHGGGVPWASVGVADTSKAYKYTIYFKPENNMDHILYFGTIGDVQNAATGASDTNPYFWAGGSAGLVQDRWYRIDAYVLPYGHELIDHSTFGGVFDTVTGEKVANTGTFRFGSQGAETGFRFFSYYGGVPGFSSQWFEPAIEKLEYTYSLLDSAGGRFAINPITGLITAAGTDFNYEAATGHNVTVRVTDAYGQYKDQTFTVGVNNVNEAPNVPNGGALVWSFFDETGLGANPTQDYGVAATLGLSDPDGGVPTLELTTAQNWFYADGNQIRFRPGLNFNFEELRAAGYGIHDWNGDGRLDAHIANVYARANDGQLVSSETLTQIFISDVNERPNNLVLEAQTLFSESLPGDTPHSGQLIARFTLSDPDQTAPALSIVGGNLNGWFTTTGNHLAFATGPDFTAGWLRSTFGQYGQDAGYYYDTDGDGLMEMRVATLTLAAVDASGTQSDPFTYNVLIENKNEAPVITSASWGNYFTETGLGGNPANSYLVAAIFGHSDPDGTAPSLQFASGGNPNNWFYISGNEVRFNPGLNFDFEWAKNAGYTVYDWNADGILEAHVATVSVQSTDGQLVSGVASTHIFIQDVNEAHGLSSGIYYLPENYFTGPLQALPQVNLPGLLSDPEQGRGITWSFADWSTQSGEFRIDPSTGQISLVNGPLDYESLTSVYEWQDVWVEDPYDPYGGGGYYEQQYVYLGRDPSRASINLSIRASDGTYSATSTATINVTDAPEGPVLGYVPRFIVRDDQANGYLGQLYGYDPDTGGAAVGYSISLGRSTEQYPSAGGSSDIDNYANPTVTVSNTGRLSFNTPGDGEWEGGIRSHPIYGGRWSYQLLYQMTVTMTDASGMQGPAQDFEIIFLKHNTSSVLPLILDLDGDGIEMVSADTSSVRFDMNGDGLADQTGWVGADDGLLVLDRNGNGVIDDAGELSFARDDTQAVTDLEGLRAWDSNRNGFLEAGDADFGRFQVWRDINQNGISEAGELYSLSSLGIRSLNLTLNLTNQELVSDRNVLFATSEFQRTDGTTGLIGDVSFAFDPEDPVTVEPEAEVAPPIVLDLDGDSAGLVSLADSKTRFDMNGDGVADKTGWIEAGDALLALDRNANGTIDDIDEISFVNDKEGAKTDLEGLAAFDSNGDGKLDGADERFVEFRAWRDANGNGLTDAGELLSLAEAGVVSISLTGTPTGEEKTAGGNIIYNKGSFTRATGVSGTLLDVGLAFKAMSKLPDIEFQSSDWNGKSRTYAITGGTTASRITPRHANGLLSADAGQIAPAAILRFDDRTVGVLSTILVDLDGDGLEARRANRSRARFDMDGDSIADNTGWVSGGDGMLVIDRDGSGSITHASELSFLAEKDGATSAWDGLSVLDSTKDGKIDVKDTRFGELKVWADRNGDGVSEADEIKSLAELGIAEISLRSVSNGESGAIGDNLPLSTSTFKWTNGVTATIGNVAMAFDPSSTKPQFGASESLAVKTANEEAAALAASRLVQAMNGFGAGLSEGSMSARWTERDLGVDMLAANAA